MEKVLVMLLTALIFFLGFLILGPDSKMPGNRYSKEEKLAVTREFARQLEADPQAPRWTGIRSTTASTPIDPPRPSRPKNNFMRPLEPPVDSNKNQLAEKIRQGGIEWLHRVRANETPGELLSAIETAFQIERDSEFLRQAEALALESIRRILQQPESVDRAKALKILEIDLLPNSSTPERRIEIEALLNEARLAMPQAPQVDR